MIEIHPDTPLPWLDVEHDVGPAMMQFLKEGIQKWSARRYILMIVPVLFWLSWSILRVTLAFEMLFPRQICTAFSAAPRRRVIYTFPPRIEIVVSIPVGYQAQLEGAETLFVKYNAQYFGADIVELDETRSCGPGKEE